MGMFDLTPEMVPAMQNQADTAQAVQAANLPTGRGGVYASSIAGNMLGRGIAGALGYEDPQMQKAIAMQQAMKETDAAGIDIRQDPIGYATLAAKNLAKYGQHDAAFAALDKVKQLSQGQLEQAQTSALTRTAQQQADADKRVAQILAASGGDRQKAAQAMAMDPNPIVQKRGEELQAKRYTAATQYGNIDNWSPDGTTIVGGDNPETPLGKLQQQLEKQQAALATMQKNSAPQTAIDAMQKRIAETQDNIKTTSQGRPNSTGIEREQKELEDLQNFADANGGLNPLQERRAQFLRAFLEQKHLSVDPVTGKQYYTQTYTVPEGVTIGRGRGGSGGAGGGGGTPVNALPTLDNGRNKLDGPTEKVMRDMGNGFSQLDALMKNYKPDFGGFKSETAASAAIELGRRGIMPGYQDTASFWSGYEQWVSKVRAADYGLTLTEYELQQFNKFRAKPSDSDASIKNNLQRQKDIVMGAAQRELRAANASGQNVKQAEALSGITMLTKEPVRQPGKPAAPAPRMPQPSPQQVTAPTPDDVITKPMPATAVPSPTRTLPASAQTPSGAGGGNIVEWEADGYAYRQLPDGTVQRKKQ